jgi:hypothetical protein
MCCILGRVKTRVLDGADAISAGREMGYFVIKAACRPFL